MGRRTNEQATNSKELSLPVFKLVHRFVESARRCEQYYHAKLLSSPIRAMEKRWRLPRAEQQRDRTLHELLQRYSHMTLQLFRRGGLAEAEWREGYRRIGQQLRVEVYGLENSRWFYWLLWRAICKALPNAGGVDVLKSKFMLRQFVDELPPHYPPDEDSHALILRQLAFEDSTQDIDENTVAKLDQAYRDLHRILVKHEKHLPVLTDGTIDSDLLRQVNEADPSSFLIYEQLLFGPLPENTSEKENQNEHT